MDFAYSGNIQQSRSDEINRNIMAFYRAELFLNDDYAIVLHNVSLLTQKREPSPRAHVLVRSVPAPKEATTSLADSSAVPRNVTIPLGGIPHSFYTGFAGVPESGLLFHSGTHVQLLLTNYPRCLTDESLVLSVASSVGSIEIPIQFRYSPLMEQICIRNFSLATSAYLYEWGLRVCVRRSMRVVILLVLSMVVLFLCFLFTGIRVNPFSTMEGKLLSLLLPEGDRGVYYELNGSEGIAVVSEGLKKSRMATVQGLSRNSGTKIVESDFVREEAKKVKEEAKVKKELVKESVKEEAKPAKEPARPKKEEKSLLETVVTKNQKAEKAKLPSERLEELAQRLQKEERRKKKEKKEKERRLAEKKKEEEKKEAEKPKPVEVTESKPVEEKSKEVKPVEEVKEVKPVEVKSKSVEAVKESKPAPEVKEVKPVEVKEVKSETRVEARKDKDVTKEPTALDTTTEDKVGAKAEDKPKEDKPEPKKVEKKKEKNHVEKPAKKPLVPVTPSNEVVKPASNETPGETPMSPLSVTPSVVSVLEEASSRVQTKLPVSPEPVKPVKQFFTAESPQPAPKSGIFPAIRAEVKPPQPAKPAQPTQPVVKPKEKKNQSRSSTPAAKVKAKQASRSASRQQKAVPDAAQKTVPETTQPASEQPPKPSVFAQRQDVDGFGNASAFQPDYGMFDSSLLPNAAWGNRGYTRNHLMGEDFYPSRGYDRQMNYDMNYAMGGLRDPVNYNRSSLLGEMNYGQLNGFDEYNAFSNYTNILPQDTMRGMQNARSYTPVGYDMSLYNEARERSSAWLSVGAGFDEALNDSLYNDRLFNYDRMNDQMMNDIDDLPSIVRDPDAVVFPSSRSGSAVRAPSRMSEGTPGFGGSDCGV